MCLTISERSTFEVSEISIELTEIPVFLCFRKFAVRISMVDFDFTELRTFISVNTYFLVGSDLGRLIKIWLAS